MRRLGCLFAIVLTGSALAQRPDYQGPTILSRGVGPVLRGGGEFARIRPFISVNGVYDNGLTPVSVDAEGEIPRVDLFGVQGTAGVLGYHSWRRTILGMDYRGSYRHYSRDTYYNGSDHVLSLGVSHQASRRVVFTLRQAAGTYSRNFAPLNVSGFFDPNFPDVPSNEFFDGRTHYLSSMGDLTLAKSDRLSFNLGGSGVFVRRRSRQLVGVTGGNARGDVAYRLSRTTAIGVDYGFTHYSFTNSFGSSDVHSVAFNYAVRLGRTWHFGLRAGASRVESTGLRRVALDPIVAAIIGGTTGLEAFHRKNYLPHGDVNLSRSFRRSSISFSYNLGTNYGNGVYLTSQRQGATASFSYTATRRWNFGISGGYDSYSSLSQEIGKYQGYRGGVGVTCQVSRMVHIVSRFDVRKFDVAESIFQRQTYRGTVGFAFSPGELPLSLW